MRSGGGGSTIVELARDGDLTSDGATLIEDITSGNLINDVGQVAFVADYSQPSVLRDGVFVAGDEGITLVGPGLLPGGSTATNNMRVAGLNDAGQVAFATEFVGGGIDPLSGVYVADANAPTLIAFEDTATPDGKFYRRFLNESITLNEDGQVAFLAELSDTANGPLSGRGLFFYDPVAGLEQIVRTGASFDGSTVSGLSFTGTVPSVSLSPDAGFSGLNDMGQVAFAYSLANGQSGVAVWTPPLWGDYNDDGIVDTADYIVWRQNKDTTDPLPNDAIGGMIGAAHFNQWQAHFGETAGEGELEVGVIAAPEPGGVVLWIVAAAVEGLRRRKRAR
jgi:hypothetical protein